MLAAVRAFYAAAKKIDLIEVNPAADVEAPSVGHNGDALLHFYTPQQMNEIIHVFDEDKDAFTRTRNKLILYLMGVEGLPSRFIGLAWRTSTGKPVPLWYEVREPRAGWSLSIPVKKPSSLSRNT